MAKVLKKKPKTKKKTSGKTKKKSGKSYKFKYLSLGKFYVTYKKLKIKKKLTKSEKKKYKAYANKAKKVVKNADKRIKKYAKKLARGGLTKAEKRKIQKKINREIVKVGKTKAVKKIRSYKKTLTKKYSKSKKGKKKTSTKKIPLSKRIENTKKEMKSKASNRAYIINNSNNKKLVFQFNPEKVPYERNVSYNTIDSPGQAYPQTQFTKGEAMEFTVDLFMYTPVVRKSVTASTGITYKYNKSGNSYAALNSKKIESAGVALDNRIGKARKFLQDLMPPMYNKKKFKRPPTCTFAFGYFVCNKCVVTGLKVEDERLDIKGTPIQTKFTLKLRRI